MKMQFGVTGEVGRQVPEDVKAALQDLIAKSGIPVEKKVVFDATKATELHAAVMSGSTNQVEKQLVSAC